ncbi:ankyrin repeat domain-containing protein [Streptomyces sp. NBC_00178]|uniref:ankyrin repeat domain-containing protein n=1 Tax=Streptomyces sp. NBC_00178 TaxID=2975672 RepID=UPI002E2997B0|nr:ankyrin repeat domain-containing protein [Streptomyces sp. NBC_00178]
MTNGPHEAATRLFDALYDGDDAVVRALRAGASAESRDEEGTTALYLACVQDLPGTVRMLLAAGADPDRASGPEDGDLPLCGAVCGGHTEVAGALLAAGADPDLREGFGFTALHWACELGLAEVAGVLLAHGADPDLPGPHGEPPLVVAARRGSSRTVRTLLGHGAGALSPALDEARRALGLDVERELRGALRALYGDEGHETVVSRAPVDGGVTVSVELRRDGEAFAGQERQTGHGAVATLLEERLGLRASFGELAGRALRDRDPDLDNWLVAVGALWLRGDEETFRAAVAWTAQDDPLRQVFGVDVLARLGFGTGGKPFADRAVPLLREVARTGAPGPAGAARRALAGYGETSGE